MNSINLKIFPTHGGSLKENSTSILEREITPEGVYRNMKGCILWVDLEGQVWQSRLFTILLILTMKLRYSQLFSNDLAWRRKGLPGGPEVGRNYAD